MSLTNLVQHLYFEQYLRQVARATARQGGVTTYVQKRQFLAPIDAWHFPKYPGRTSILAPATPLVPALRHFIIANEYIWREPDCWLGTWINPATHCCYLDITTYLVDLEEARRVALELSVREGRAIVALYNAKRNQTVYL